MLAAAEENERKVQEIVGGGAAVAGAIVGGGEGQFGDRSSTATAAVSAARGLDFGIGGGGSSPSTSSPGTAAGNSSALSSAAAAAADGSAGVAARGSALAGESGVGKAAVLPKDVDFSVALQDQSYATDSETEELEKKRFFEKVEQFGKIDYSALRWVLTLCSTHRGVRRSHHTHTCYACMQCIL